jgi:uncharacterized protein (DUF2384 family)
MVDLYYADLSRSVLNDALGKLQSAQEYAIRAKLSPNQLKRIQRIINSARLAIDIIGYSEEATVNELAQKQD